MSKVRLEKGFRGTPFARDEPAESVGRRVPAVASTP
jgi:hypothetical protein